MPFAFTFVTQTSFLHVNTCVPSISSVRSCVLLTFAAPCAAALLVWQTTFVEPNVPRCVPRRQIPMKNRAVSKTIAPPQSNGSTLHRCEIAAPLALSCGPPTSPFLIGVSLLRCPAQNAWCSDLLRSRCLREGLFVSHWFFCSQFLHCSPFECRQSWIWRLHLLWLAWRTQERSCC